MILLFPLAVSKQQVVGIATNSKGYLAVAVDSVHLGETTYLYIYSDDNKLQETVWLYGFRGGISAIREENDLIGIYYNHSKYTYDYTGTLLLKETVDEEITQSAFKCKNGNAEYVYSKNKIGFEKVKKYTDDGKRKTVFKGISLYINKLSMSLSVTALAAAIIYCMIFHSTKRNYSAEDLREIDAKIREIFREKGNIRRKIKVSVYLFIAAAIIVPVFSPLISAYTFIYKNFFG